MTNEYIFQCASILTWSYVTLVGAIFIMIGSAHGWKLALWCATATWVCIDFGTLIIALAVAKIMH